MLSHQQILQFRTFGYVVLRGLLSPAEAAALRAEVTAALTGAFGTLGTEPDDGGGISGDYRNALELTSGNLGQHLSVLEKAGLVQIEKGYEGKRPRTWVTLTPAGEKALREEIAHLKRLIQHVEQAAP